MQWAVGNDWLEGTRPHWNGLSPKTGLDWINSHLIYPQLYIHTSALTRALSNLFLDAQEALSLGIRERFIKKKAKPNKNS